MHFTLKRGANDHPIYKYVHDMKAIPASERESPCYYLLVCADVVWPAHPETLVPGCFTVLIQLSDHEGVRVYNWPAHIVQEDLDLVQREFSAFIEKNRRRD